MYPRHMAREHAFQFDKIPIIALILFFQIKIKKKKPPLKNHAIEKIGNHTSFLITFEKYTTNFYIYSIYVHGYV